jgi:hypothetical protein
MSIVIFAVGVLVFFFTVYGTVIAGGLHLTKQQLETSPELASDLAAGTSHPKDGLGTRDVMRSDF